MNQNLLLKALRNKILSIQGLGIADRVYDEEGTPNATLPYVVIRLLEDNEDGVFSGSRQIIAIAEISVWGSRDDGSKASRALSGTIYTALANSTLTDASPNIGCSVIGVKRGMVNREEDGYKVTSEYLICGTLDE